MAIAVPFIASAMGAGAVATAAISIGFAVTGISAKIDKAASKVFGEDLVKVANIAGAAFAVYNGGFSLGGTEAAGNVAGAAAGADAAFEADWASATGGGLTSAEATASSAASNAAFDADWASATGGDAFKMADGSGFNLQQAAMSPSVDPSVGTNLKTGATTMADSKPSMYSVAEPTTVAAPQAAATQAAGSNATASIATANKYALTPPAGNATQGIAANASGYGLQAPANALNPQQSFFGKLLNNVGDKTMAGLIQGAGQGYAAAQQEKLAKERMAIEEQRYRSVPSFSVQYRNQV